MPLDPTISSQIALGPNAKVDLQLATGGSWLAFNVIEGSYSDMGQKSDVTDSEHVTQTANAIGLQTFSCSLTLQLDRLMTTTGSTGFTFIFTRPNYLVGLRLYPWGRTAAIGVAGNAINYFSVPAFRITGGDGSFVVQGSRPQTFRIAGESDANGGAYKRPGDV